MSITDALGDGSQLCSFRMFDSTNDNNSSVNIPHTITPISLHLRALAIGANSKGEVTFDVGANITTSEASVVVQAFLDELLKGNIFKLGNSVGNTSHILVRFIADSGQYDGIELAVVKNNGDVMLSVTDRTLNLFTFTPKETIYPLFLTYDGTNIVFGAGSTALMTAVYKNSEVSPDDIIDLTQTVELRVGDASGAQDMVHPSDVTIFDRALSTKEIHQVNTARKTNQIADLFHDGSQVAYFPLEQHKEDVTGTLGSGMGSEGYFYNDFAFGNLRTVALKNSAIGSTLGDKVKNGFTLNIRSKLFTPYTTFDPIFAVFATSNAGSINSGITVGWTGANEITAKTTVNNSLAKTHVFTVTALRANETDTRLDFDGSKYRLFINSEMFTITDDIVTGMFNKDVQLYIGNGGLPFQINTRNQALANAFVFNRVLTDVEAGAIKGYRNRDTSTPATKSTGINLHESHGLEYNGQYVKGLVFNDGVAQMFPPKPYRAFTFDGTLLDTEGNDHSNSGIPHSFVDLADGRRGLALDATSAAKFNTGVTSTQGWNTIVCFFQLSSSAPRYVFRLEAYGGTRNFVFQITNTDINIAYLEPNVASVSSNATIAALSYGLHSMVYTRTAEGIADTINIDGTMIPLTYGTTGTGTPSKEFDTPIFISADYHGSYTQRFKGRTLWFYNA